MFVGHLAVALAAKRAAPAVNLGWLMAGVTALDLVWPVFVLAGIEHVRVVQGATAFTPLIFDSYPWSHSLVMSVVWGLALVLVARSRGVIAPAWLLVALVVGWSNFAITAKRFHDFGKPTAFALIAFLVGFILVIALSFVKGDPGPNRYGATTNTPA